MDYLYEKVSYLRGLAEGLEIDEKSKEGKLLLHIVDALEEFANAIVDVYDEHQDLVEYVELMDEDLAEVEDEVFDEYEDDYTDEYEDEYDFEDDIDYVEVRCPNCDEIIYLDKDLIDDEEDTHCPNCDEVLVNNENNIE